MLNDLLSVLVFVPFVALGIFAYRSDKKTWNNGVCSKNGLPWTRFDTDSQGGRMYKAGDEYCSISWPFVDR